MSAIEQRRTFGVNERREKDYPGRRTANSAEVCGSGAVLSELLGEVAGEPLQVEVSAVRVLFELLGFLLRNC